MRDKYGSVAEEGAPVQPRLYQRPLTRDEAFGRMVTTRPNLLATISLAAVVGGAALLSHGAASVSAPTQQLATVNKPVAPELASLLSAGTTSIDLASCGAVADVESHADGVANAAALQRCLEAADLVDGVGEVVVSSTYTLTPMYVTGLSDVTLRVEGELRASTNITAWPTAGAWGTTIGNMLMFKNCTGLSLVGNGVLNGQGTSWWTRATMALIFSTPFNRPRILEVWETERIHIQGLRFLNSPYFHVYVKESKNILIEDASIHVEYDVESNMVLAELLANETLHGMGMSFKTAIPDIEALDLASLSDDEITLLEDEVLALLDSYGGFNDLKDGSLTFPLNTDGFDVAGTNVVIRNVTIRNFDDAVAIKSSDSSDMYSTCSSNVLVEDVKVEYGLGMTIGSISPDYEIPCIENVVFRNIEFSRPFKAVYVKTGTRQYGSASVRNITWENLKISEPLWYAVYVGPQQTLFETEGARGCSLYPVTSTDCETNARVTISDLTLRHVHSTGGFNPIPGVLRGNASNPIRGVHFEDVSIKCREDGAYLNESKWATDKDFVCENVVDSTAVDADPTPWCF